MERKKERKKEECVEDGMGCDDENGWKGKKFGYRGLEKKKHRSRKQVAECSLFGLSKKLLRKLFVYL